MLKLRSKISIFILFALSCLALFHCAEQPAEPPKTTASLKISLPVSSVYAGGSLQLLAVATLRDGTQSDVTQATTWSLAPGRAGTINSKGLFTASGNEIGVETVRADYQGHSSEVQIEITKRAVSLTVWPSTATVVAGRSLQFEAISEFQDVTQEYVTSKVSWRINPGVAATIDTNGVLSAKAGASGEETVAGSFQAYSAQSKVQIKASFESPFEMVLIPAGNFTMGDDNGHANEKPAHEVFVSAFQIGKYEVTNRQYVDYLNAAQRNGEIIYESSIVTAIKGPFAGREYCRIAGGPEFPDRFIEYLEVEPGAFEFQARAGFENFPVVRVHWWGAAAFCAFYGLRLPTEAEWEKACRGGQQFNYGTSDGTLSHDLANYIGKEGRDQFEGVAPVGSFPPNPYGLHDMSGNAAEYVFDLYGSDYYANSPRNDPKGPGPAMLTQNLPGSAIWRGGAWTHDANACRAALRGSTGHQIDPNYLAGSLFGFRVARSQ